MKQKIERPDYVQNFDKPKNTEIKYINGKWYLYGRESVYDPVTKRRTKKSGSILGRITPDGLVPSKRRKEVIVEIEPAAEEVPATGKGGTETLPPLNGGGAAEEEKTEAPVAQSRPEPVVEEILDAGAVVYLIGRTEKMRTQLQKIFPRKWTAIYCMAMLRAIYVCTLAEMQIDMDRSLLHKIYPDVPLDKKSITDLLQKSLTRRNTQKYLEKDMKKRTLYLLLEGQRLLYDAPEEDPDLYDEMARYMEQRNILYAFAVNADKTVALPAFYTLFERSTIDELEFALTRADLLSAERVTGLGDKETARPECFQLLQELNVPYLIPLRRDSPETKDFRFGDLEAYSGYVLEQDRVIACTSLDREKDRIFAYLDPHLQTAEFDEDCRRRERERLARKTRKRYPEPLGQNYALFLGADGYLSCAVMEEEREAGGPRTYGSLALQTDDDKLTPEDGYRIYKLRRQMEKLFQLWDDLQMEDLFYLDGDGFEGCLFLDYLASQMIAEAADQLHAVGEDQEMDGHSWLTALNYVQCVRMDGKWMFPPVDEDVDAICKKIGLNPTDIGSVGVQ